MTIAHFLHYDYYYVDVYKNVYYFIEIIEKWALKVLMKIPNIK